MLSLLLLTRLHIYHDLLLHWYPCISILIRSILVNQLVHVALVTLHTMEITDRQEVVKGATFSFLLLKINTFELQNIFLRLSTSTKSVSILQIHI